MPWFVLGVRIVYIDFRLSPFFIAAKPFHAAVATVFEVLQPILMTLTVFKRPLESLRFIGF